MLALVVLLVIDVIANPSFLSIRMQDGHLYGNLIDILRNGAPVLLVALGMTLVIATRGIDLSVGAVAAIAGAIACVYIVGADQPGSAGTAIIACSLALAACVALGLWNGFLVAVLGIQPIIATLVLMTAGRGLAMLVTDGQITTVNNDTFAGIGVGLRAHPAGGHPGRARCLRPHGAGHPAYGPGHADRVGRDQPGGQPAGRRAVAHHHLDRLRVLRGCAPAWRG